MVQDDPITSLRAATADDVTRAYERAYIDRPDIPAIELLKFFNRMIDVLVDDREGE